MKLLLRVVLLLPFVIGVGYAHAADGVPSELNPLALFVGLLIAAAGFMAAYILNGISRKLDKLFRTQEEHNTRLSKLEGRLEAR